MVTVKFFDFFELRFEVGKTAVRSQKFAKSRCFFVTAPVIEKLGGFEVFDKGLITPFLLVKSCNSHIFDLERSEWLKKPN